MSYSISVTNAPAAHLVGRINDEIERFRTIDTPAARFEITQLEMHRAHVESVDAAIPGVVFSAYLNGHASQGFKPAHVNTVDGEPPEPGITAGRSGCDLTFNMPAPVEELAELAEDESDDRPF